MRRLSALLAAVALGLTVAPTVLAAAPTPPLDGLVLVQHDLAFVASQARSPAALQLVRAAQGTLAGATVAALWIDRGHAVAPGYGLTVFEDSRGALLDLERAPAGSLPSAAVSAVETEILGADRALAEGSILQALGGSGGLLARARGMILSGDRWATTSRVDLAAEQYGTGWQDAFEALTALVVLRTALLSPGTVATGAERALAQVPRIRPAGVRVLRGRGALARAGKPEVLFVGDESCAACAIERWGLVVALWRFGVFTSLRLGESATTASPFVRSFTFLGVRYVSPFVSFEAVELSSDAPSGGGGYVRLGQLTPRQRRLVGALDPRATVPFIDVANRFADTGASVSPAFGAGQSWSQLAAAPSRPRMLPGRAIAASAEVVTAEICRATGGQPSVVCRSGGVQAYGRALARFGGRGSGCAVARGELGLGERAARRVAQMPPRSGPQRNRRVMSQN